MKKLLAIILAALLCLSAVGAWAEDEAAVEAVEAGEASVETEALDAPDTALIEAEAPEAPAGDLWAEAEAGEPAEANEAEETAEANPTGLETVDFDFNSFTFSVVPKLKIAAVKKYNGSSMAVTVPSTIKYGSNTYDVKSIGEDAFAGNSDLVKITLPDSVTAIDVSAFDGCSSLTTVTLGSGLTTIGASAFYGCTELTTLEIPESVVVIGTNAFAISKAGKSVPNLNLSLIETSGGFKYSCPVAGASCKVVGYTGTGTSITIPATYQSVYDAKNFNVTVIDEDVFSNLDITSVVLPDSIKEIGVNAFGGCAKLSSMTFGSGLKTIGNSAFSGCTALKSALLPEGVESIGEFAFLNCTSLTKLNLGQLKTMGDGAFMGCSALSSVTLPDTLEEVPILAFAGCENLTKLDLGKGVKVIKGSPLGGAFVNCTALEDLVIPDGVTEIGEAAFSGCTALKNVKIPASVTTIGKDAFDAGLPGLVIECPVGSAAAEYAKNAGIAIKEAEKVKLEDCAIAPIPDQVKTGSALEPDVAITYGASTLVKGTDYELTYADNVDVGTARVTITGKGAYEGTKEVTFAILAAPVSLEDCSFAPIPDHLFIGAPVTPALTVSYGEKTLAAGVDYDAAYASNTAVGTAKVTVTGKGAYTGIKELSFEIKSKLNLKDAVIEDIPDQPPTGSEITPKLTVICGGKVLEEGTDYEVTYSQNIAVGVAVATISGKGSYEGAQSKTFNIKEPVLPPAGTTIKKLSRGRKQITVTWKKQAVDSNGYLIQYGLKSDFSDAKTVKVAKTGTTKKTIKKLKAKKKYYVRICTYKLDGATEVPSEWSPAKSIKTK